MASLNKVSLIGNVGKDPEIRSTTNGAEIASFSIATSESWRDKATGERKSKSEWHNIVLFSEHLVNLAKSYIKKGSRLYLEGKLQTRKWSDKDGVERYSTEIILQGFDSKIILLSSKDEGQPSEHNQAKQNAYVDDLDLDDSIPF